MPGPVIQAQPLPDWADPKQASVMDPLYKTLARKATGALGLDDPNTAIMGTASPLAMVESAPSGLIAQLLKFKTMSEPAATLIQHLSRVTPAEIDPTAQALGQKVATRAPSPTNFKNMFSRMLTRVPEAEGVIEPAFSNHTTMHRGGGVSEAYGKQAAFREKMNPTPEAIFNLDKARGVYDRPSVTDPSQLRDVLMSQATKAAAEAKPRPAIIQQSGRAGIQNASTQRGLKMLGIEPQDIKDIRNMSLETAQAAFPNIKKTILSDIIKGYSYSGIR